MTQEKQTKSIFCANCQKETPHIAEVDANGELVFTCTIDGCERVIKLPANTTPESANEYFATHKESNQGQVSLAPQEETLKTLLTSAQEQPEE